MLFFAPLRLLVFWIERFLCNLVYNKVSSYFPIVGPLQSVEWKVFIVESITLLEMCEMNSTVQSKKKLCGGIEKSAVKFSYKYCIP